MRCKLSLLILVLLPLFSIAQNKDLELWGSMKFSKKLTKKIRFELEEQIRWADSLSQYKKNFTNLGVKYKVHKKHFLSLNLRLVDEVDELKYMRSHVDLNSDFDLNHLPLVFNQRLRFQQAWDSEGALDKTYVRSKWGLVMKSKFITPYIAHEFYWQIIESKSLDKQRSTIGVTWDMSDDMKMKLFLRRQTEINKKNPDILSIIGFGTHYKF